MPSVSLRKNRIELNQATDTSYIVIGSENVITMAADAALVAYGPEIDITATGTADIVTIGGDGGAAANAADNFVTFDAGGTLNVLAFARTEVAGDGVTAWLAGHDSFGIRGDGDVITAAGVGDALWIGQILANGARDAVDFHASGSLFVLDNSATSLKGSRVTTTLNGGDRLAAIGAGDVVNAVGSGISVTIGGNGFRAGAAGDDVVNFAAGGVFAELANSSLVLSGDGVTGAVRQDDFLAATGSGLVVAASAGHDVIAIGGNGEAATGAAMDRVYFQDGSGDQEVDDTVDVASRSSVAAQGGGVEIRLAGDDSVTAIGHDIFVTSGGANNQIVLGGDHCNSADDPQDLYGLGARLNQGDVLTLLSNTTATATRLAMGPGPAAGAATIEVNADDLIAISGGAFAIDVIATAGTDAINGFSTGDTLNLAARFASVDALIAATTPTSAGAEIHLDAAGDTLTLRNTSLSAFAAFAHAGAITFMA